MNKTVLIAYDNTDVVDLLTCHCRAIGLNVDSANNAVTTLGRAEETLPDVVIVDIDMRYADSLSVCEMMANRADLRTIPVIVLTDNSEEETVRRCHQLRAYYVPKCSDLWSRVGPLLRDLFNLEEVAECQQHGESPVEPDADEARGPMNLIDTVFAVLGVETGDSLFGDDLNNGEKRSDHPWVLTIDDDDDIALALRLRLKEYGVQVLRAAEGMEGYRRAFMEVPQAIILDYELPQCNGAYVLRRLKESPVTRNIPVIVLTGHRETSIERQMWELGANEYLTKPLDWNRLRAALQVFLDVNHPNNVAIDRPMAVRGTGQEANAAGVGWPMCH
jgi:DNA-binding response OmpR family regulator